MPTETEKLRPCHPPQNPENRCGKGRHAERKTPMANTGSSLQTAQYLSE